MNTTTSNHCRNEGAAFEIPQLDAGALAERARASADGAAGASDAPGRSMAASLSRSLAELQSRLAKAQARASEAEEQLAAHLRHCICRADAVAEATACEAADGDADRRAAIS